MLFSLWFFTCLSLSTLFPCFCSVRSGTFWRAFARGARGDLPLLPVSKMLLILIYIIPLLFNPQRNQLLAILRLFNLSLRILEETFCRNAYFSGSMSLAHFLMGIIYYFVTSFEDSAPISPRPWDSPLTLGAIVALCFRCVLFLEKVSTKSFASYSNTPHMCCHIYLAELVFYICVAGLQRFEPISLSNVIWLVGLNINDANVQTHKQESDYSFSLLI
jgi:hypothetical protein